MRIGAAIQAVLSGTPASPPAGQQKLYATTAGPWATVGASGRVRLMAAGDLHNVSDYGALGNGVANDAPAIQAALDVASTEPGCRVYVPPGTYLITSELEIKGSVSLELAPGATIRRGSSAMQYMLKNFNSSYAPTLYGGRGGVRISGGTWDARGAALTGSCTAIILAHAHDVQITGVTIADVRDWHAIELSAVRRGVVRDCTFAGFNPVAAGRIDGEAVQIDLPLSVGTTPGIGAGALDSTPCQDILITGCTARASSTLASWGTLVGTHSYADGVVHTGIRITDCYGEALNDYLVRGYNWRQVVVANCTGISCNGGVRMEVPTSATVQVFDDIVISGNTFRDLGTLNAASNVVSGGISIIGLTTPASVPVRDVLIQGNVLRGVANADGIDAVNVADLIVDGNTLKTGAGGSTGMYIDSCFGAVIANNKIDTFDGGSINLTKVGAFTSDACTISGNVIAVSGTLTIDSSYVAVTGNVISNPSGTSAAIVVTGAALATAIVGNALRKVSGSSAKGIENNHTSTLIQANNTRGWGGVEGSTGVIHRVVALTPNMATTTASTTNLNRYAV